MKIVILIRSLGFGGAERQAVQMAQSFVEMGHAVSIVTFYSRGGLEPELEGSGVKLICLNKRRRWEVFSFLWRLCRAVRFERPDVLYCFEGTANIIAAVLRPALNTGKLVWGIRSTTMDSASQDGLSKAILLFGRLLSRIPDCIIVNSFAGKNDLVSRSYPIENLRVVHNGIDTRRFSPCYSDGLELRRRLRIRENEILVGSIGRLYLQKDYKTFLRAAKIASERHSNLKFICVAGPNGINETYKSELLQLCANLGINDRVIWHPQLRAIEQVHRALDIFCSSSAFGEGFSNVIAESMACGKPCVVTDVGDSRVLVGDIGIVVPPRRPEELAEALHAMIERISEPNSISEFSRQRVEHRFSTKACVENTLTIFNEL